MRPALEFEDEEEEIKHEDAPESEDGHEDEHNEIEHSDEESSPDSNCPTPPSLDSENEEDESEHEENYKTEEEDENKYGNTDEDKAEIDAVGRPPLATNDRGVSERKAVEDLTVNKPTKT